MSAMLLTAGPVVTHSLVVNFGPRCLRGMAHTTKALFQRACDKLQSANLGVVAFISTAQIFVKRRPTEIGPYLTENSDLCNLDLYTQRYSMPSPSSITYTMKTSMISLGLVSEEDFKRRNRQMDPRKLLPL